MQGLGYRHSTVYLVAALVSIILSFWINYHNDIINPDAICYLQSAETVSSGLHAVMSLCDQSRWPFYPMLVAATVYITKLSYLHAAYLLNGIFSCLTVLIFIRITACFTDKQRILWLAALVMLLSNEFNGNRSDIIRDHGFWCFYLLSVLSFILYFKHRQWKYVFGWSMSLVVATLFRLEGAIFLVLMPFLVWLESGQHFTFRCKEFLRLNTILLITAGLLIGVMFIHPDISLGRLSEFRTQLQFSHIYSELIHQYIMVADMLGKFVLGRSVAYQNEIYITTLIGWYLFYVIMVLTVVNLVLLVYAWHQKLLKTERTSYLVLWGYIAVNVAITFIFLIESRFLSKRYVFALVLLLMLWLPFAWDSLLAKWRVKKWPVVLCLVLTLFDALGGVFGFGHSKKYIHEAGDWLAIHAPSNAAIYSNDYQVMYYSHHFGNQIFQKAKEFADLTALQGDKWKQYDYIAVHINKKNALEAAQVIESIKKDPVIVFSNKRGSDQIKIYQRNIE